MIGIWLREANLANALRENAIFEEKPTIGALHCNYEQPVWACTSFCLNAFWSTQDGLLMASFTDTSNDIATPPTLEIWTLTTEGLVRLRSIMIRADNDATGTHLSSCCNWHVRTSYPFSRR